MMARILFAFLFLLTSAGARAQEDFSDLLDPANLRFETFRDVDGQFELRFALDPEGKLALGALTTVTPAGDREIQIAEARTFAWDRAGGRLSIALPRNDAKIVEISGSVATIDREAFVARKLAARIAVEGGAVRTVDLFGSQLRLKGKRDCLVDASPGANLAQLTLKGRWKPDRGDWLSPTAKTEGWLPIRRRIDFVEGTDEFDVAVPAGRELSALAAVGRLEDVVCLSFGVDDTDGADASRIVDLPDGTLFQDKLAGGVRPLVDIASFFQGPRFEETRPGVEFVDAGIGASYRVVLVAKGRYFGLTQGADIEHRVTLAVRLGRSPTRAGPIREALRLVIKGITRKSATGADEIVPHQPGEPNSVFEPILEWQGRYAEAIATTLGGQVN